MHSKRTGTHRYARVGANNTSEKMDQTGTVVHQVARAMEEQLREDKQELKTQENKKKAKDAKRIREIVYENDKNKGTSHVQDEMGKLMHRDDNNGVWLDPELCARARREEVESIRRHKTHTRVPGEACPRETAKAPIKTG